MSIQTINSENGGQEGKWIAFLCALILLLGWLLLPHNQAIIKQTSLAPYQVSIKSLSSKPLAMIADLRLAHEEIQHLYQQQGEWESALQLEQAWVAPFVKDKSWINQGQHSWTQIAPGSYQGVPSGDGASYVLNSLSRGVDVWIDLNQQANLISLQSEKLQSSQLVQAGWTQVVFQKDEMASKAAFNNH